MAKDTRLVILGEGPTRRAIETEVRDLGLSGQVELPGYRDPAPYYAQASCFAMTSTRETFGLVIIEALAAGLPIVTTDSGGPTEICGDLVSVVHRETKRHSPLHSTRRLLTKAILRRDVPARTSFRWTSARTPMKRSSAI